MVAEGAVAGACLGDDTIAALVEGGLGDGGAGAARAHLATCTACRKLVAAAVDAGAGLQGDGGGRSGATATGGPSTLRGVATAAGSFSPGSVVAGRYRIERPLGEGGMGRVFAARQVGLERPVAVKILRPELAGDALALARFHREARLVAQLISEHVVRVHDLGALPTGEPYLVMELLEGEDLAAVVARGVVATDQAVAWIVAACDALGEAHALGIVHRDIKPSNLFLTRSGKLKVLDFGLAKLAAPPGSAAARGLTMTGAGVLLGSPHYMAPEQIVGARDVDPRADVWSLGATLYHLVTGRPPFAESTLDAVFTAILAGAQPSYAGIRPDVAAVIGRALARNPSQRYASARELAAALRGEARPGAASSAAIGPHRSRWPIVAVLGAFLAGVGVMLLLWKPWATPPPAPTRPPAVEDPLAVKSPASSGSGVASSTPPAPTPVSPPPSRPRADSAPDGSDPSPPAGDTSSPHARLGNLDETRLRTRVEHAGWTITEANRETFPNCDHLRLLIDKGDVRNADVYLFDCISADVAASEAARMRRGFRNAWIVVDANAVLIVMLPDEAASKELATALLSP